MRIIRLLKLLGKKWSNILIKTTIPKGMSVKYRCIPAKVIAIESDHMIVKGDVQPGMSGGPCLMQLPNGLVFALGNCSIIKPSASGDKRDSRVLINLYPKPDTSSIEDGFKRDN